MGKQTVNQVQLVRQTYSVSPIFRSENIFYPINLLNGKK
jgi:hypothetical protein